MPERSEGSRPAPGDVLTFYEMCDAEGQGMLQQGMRFREPPAFGIILMSTRAGAPYNDAVAADGTIAYEGHDRPARPGEPHPKTVDQAAYDPLGRLTQNGRFAQWTDSFKRGSVRPARFHVYEKLLKGIWTYRGAYELTDYVFGPRGGRSVFGFQLRPCDEDASSEISSGPAGDDSPGRLIPTWVKQEVFKPDRGRCVRCGASDRLHFDHIIPISRGGASDTPQNVQLLCQRHNLEKSNRIQ